MSEENNQPVTLDLRKIYVSDLSIEVPHAPEIFNENLNPEITLGVNHDIKALAGNGEKPRRRKNHLPD